MLAETDEQTKTIQDVAKAALKSLKQAGAIGRVYPGTPDPSLGEASAEDAQPKISVTRREAKNSPSNATVTEYASRM